MTDSCAGDDASGDDQEKSPSLSSPSIKTKKHDWGTRTHIIVLVEDRKQQQLQQDDASNDDENDYLIHFFTRSVEIKIDVDGPRHGPANQPNFGLFPKEWKHLVLPHRRC